MINEIFVLTYRHKHGEDVSVYSTGEDAQRAVADVIREYFGDIEKVEDMEVMFNLLTDKKYEEAMNMWHRLTYDTEYFEITAQNVFSNVPHPKLSHLKQIIDERRE